MGLIWYLFWLWLCFEKPSVHPTISARELNYIESSLGSVKQAAAPTLMNTPWKEFFTSMPVYAIIVANFCRSWNFYLLVLFQASYLHSFNFEVSAVRTNTFTSCDLTLSIFYTYIWIISFFKFKNVFNDMNNIHIWTYTNIILITYN